VRSQVECRTRLEGRILVAGVAMLLAALAARAQSCTVNATTDTGVGSGSRRPAYPFGRLRRGERSDTKQYGRSDRC
jgi:hypothetical protein